jgi:small-conductance mechanosensitive channel
MSESSIGKPPFWSKKISISFVGGSMDEALPQESLEKQQTPEQGQDLNALKVEVDNIRTAQQTARTDDEVLELRERLARLFRDARRPILLRRRELTEISNLVDDWGDPTEMAAWKVREAEDQTLAGQLTAIAQIEGTAGSAGDGDHNSGWASEHIPQHWPKI